jgi:hypothetical protein
MLELLVLALSLTWLLEWGLSWSLLRRPARTLAGPVLLANALTNPLVNAAILELRCDLWTVEVAATLAETALYALLLRLTLRRALGLSLAANGLTLLAGLGLQRLVS